MRSIPFILAAFAFSAPALAQSWEEYSYPEYAISVAFPTNPKIETTTYEIADGRSVPARVYSARQDKGEFKMTIADLANTGLDEKAVIDHAIKRLSKGGTAGIAVIATAIPARPSTLSFIGRLQLCVGPWHFLEKLGLMGCHTACFSRLPQGRRMPATEDRSRCGS